MTADLRGAVVASPVAEFTTVRDGRPATVPLTPFHDAERDVVVVTSPPAFAGKARRAAANPTVGLLLDGPDGPLHLVGTATVREDDLEANAARVEALIEAEPSSPKRAAMRRATRFLHTRLGLLLFDWYGLRILVEIEPDRIEPVEPAAAPGIDAWPDAGLDAAEAATYDRAVATLLEDGRPRTWPLDGATVSEGRLRSTPPADVSPSDGEPACVLCHWYDDDLRRFGQRLVRGRVRGDAPFGIEPASAFELRNETALDALRFVLAGKRRTRRYFAARGESYRFVPDPGTLLRWER